MKIIIAPDKFKGSLSAMEVCSAVEEGVRSYLHSSEIIKLPLADGGDGSLNVLRNIIQFKNIFIEIKDPLFRTIKTSYGILNDTAFIEMASASGLELLSGDERNPMLTTSYGTGEIILDALKKGVKKIYLFVGGSASNDAGMGIATALGYEFRDEQNNILKPIGANLIKIKNINTSNSVPFVGVKVKVLTDVNNLLFGKNGAAHIFAKQKGANRGEIYHLDKGLENFSERVKSTFGIEVASMPGGGAGGGVGAGAVVFCNAKIKSGIATILDLLLFDEHLQETDLVITGEGLLDKQTLEGKVVKGIAERCKNGNTPLAIVCGSLTLTKSELSLLHTKIVEPIKTNGISQKDAMENAYFYLTKISEKIIKEFKSKL